MSGLDPSFIMTIVSLGMVLPKSSSPSLADSQRASTYMEFFVSYTSTRRSLPSLIPQFASTVAYQTYIRRAAPTEEDDAQNAKFFGGPTYKVLENADNLPWSAYIGAAGMPGKTAVMAWKEYAETEEGKGKGQVAFVSAGSGPVGQMVIQMAKRDGMKVITSAGSDAKIQFCKDIGADVAFNCTSISEFSMGDGPHRSNLNFHRQDR
jgi:hypothetical protein